ncbi:MAG: cobalamin-binding protein [Candidatus Cloacimonadaceae bacterium]|jgi:iron complex transport system substrate-binding protein|nr:cobalamin-binding protein [Candidatus Cloacimonadota bacterium]MDD5624774.1 cobalamin-binding protein [Candidatus Cloacimonadota bacterium]MDY0112398.1 cobalamin-binding protein [Candidatus Syntrophosphaera sp.]
MMKISNLYIWTLVLLLVVMLSCSKQEQVSSGQKIVVLSPEIAEIIASLGATEHLVGRTSECDYPPQLLQVPVVGNFGAINKEKVIALKPDLVFTSALEQDAIAQELGKIGIRVHQIYPQKLDDLPVIIRQIGDLIGKEKEAEALSDSISIAINQVRSAAQKISHPKVYVEIYRNPLMSVSDESFVGDVIESAGGDNIFSKLERDYARIDPEDVILAKPDIIICYSQDTMAGICSRKGWNLIPAVQNQRIYFEQDIDPDLIQQATPRTVQGLWLLYDIFSQQMKK